MRVGKINRARNSILEMTEMISQIVETSGQLQMR